MIFQIRGGISKMRIFTVQDKVGSRELAHFDRGAGCRLPGFCRAWVYVSWILTMSVHLQAADLPPELSLSKAVELASARHTDLAAASARVSGTDGLRRQAAVLPNPSLTFQSENWRFDGPVPFQPGRELDLFAFLSQPIEMGGKRSRRMDLAKQDSFIAELEKKGIEWRIRQDVKQSYWRALLAQQEWELMKENARTFQQIIEYHRVRVEQGAMAEADLIKVRLEGERLSLSEQAAALEAERARVGLLRAMGMQEGPIRFRLVEPPAVLAGNLVLKDLQERARSQRVEVLLGLAFVERARAEVGVQRSQAKPDWNAVVGYKRTNGYNTILAGVSVPLPLFNRNTGNTYFSTLELERAEFLLKSALARVEADLASALSGLRHRYAMLAQMEKGMLDRAEQSSRIALATYQEGGTDLLRLLDAQRARNDVQLLYTRTRLEYRLSLAELENAVGEDNLGVGEELLRVD
jgi:outer membrane protein, heavy metal efflux system